MTPRKPMTVFLCLLLASCSVYVCRSGTTKTSKEPATKYAGHYPLLSAIAQQYDDWAPTHANKLPRDKASLWAWTNNVWTGNDRPYLQIVNHIDGMTDRAKITQLRDQYAATAQAHPQDARALFGWGYAAWKIDLLIEETEKPRYWAGSDESLANRQHMAFVVQRMYFTPSPKNYPYDRLRFLLSVYNEAQEMQIAKTEPLLIYGEKLFQHNPSDVSVGRAVINLSDDYSPPRTQVALDTAHEMLRRSPNDATIYGQIFFAEFLAFVGSKSKADGDAAIGAWHKAQQYASPGQFDDPTIPLDIKYILKNEK